MKREVAPISKFSTLSLSPLKDCDLSKRISKTWPSYLGSFTHVICTNSLSPMELECTTATEPAGVTFHYLLRGELAVSYRWTDRVREITGWSSRLQEITDLLRGIGRIYPSSIKESLRMWTCNRSDLQTLGSQPVMQWGSKLQKINFFPHWSERATVILMIL